MLALGALAGSVAAAPGAIGAPAVTGTQRFIVELTGSPALAGITGLTSPDKSARSHAVARAKSRMPGLRSAQSRFSGAATAAGLKLRVLHSYTQTFDGVAVQLPAAQAAKLAALPGVRAVYPDATVHIAAVTTTATRGTSLAGASGTGASGTGAGGTGATGTGASSTGLPEDPDGVPADVTITGAPQVWQTRTPAGEPDLGQGQIVAVLDTGIDYNDPDLGGGFGPGYKVVAGYNYVAGTGDPMDDNGHGTLVAGIIAGHPADGTGRWGEAPDAELTAYKVLDSTGSGDEATVIEGLDEAVSASNPYRATIVNMSLGSPGDMSDPLAQAAQTVTDDGVVVVAAAGNDGPGQSTVESPAIAPGVLAAGASITGVVNPTVSLVSPLTQPIASTRAGFSANPPAGGEQLQIVNAGSGQPSDYQGLDVVGKAVLISYPPGGDIAPEMATAEQNGAKAVLIYTPDYYNGGGGGIVLGPNQPAGQPAPGNPAAAGQAAAGETTREPVFAADVPAGQSAYTAVAVIIGGSDATQLKSLLTNGPVTIGIQGTDETDDIASFSSQGPVPGSYQVKPDLLAPGVEIESTWPGGYNIESGTSFAAPHVAGAAALLRADHPLWSTAQVTAALTGGSHLLTGYDTDAEGAGRLNVAAANQLGVLASPRTLTLGLAGLGGPHVTATAPVTLSNTASHAEQLTLTTAPAPGTGFAATVQPQSVRIPAGGSASVTVRLSGPRPSAFGDVTGWLRASTPGVPTLSVPYLLASRPLQLHAEPDPTDSGAEVLMYSEPALAGPPVLAISSPGARPIQVTSQAVSGRPGWYEAFAPASRTGVYQISATATATSGAALYGTSTFQETSAPAASASWQAVGPDNEGAFVTATTSNPDLSYAIPSFSRHAELFRSEDGAKSWQELSQFPVGDGAAVGLAVDPQHPDTVYLEVNGNSADPTYQGRILVSNDAGDTWTTLPFPDVSTLGLTIDPTGQILVAKGVQGDFYLSLDRGQTWTEYPAPDGNYIENTAILGHDLYLATTGGLYVIRDFDSVPQAAQQVLSPPNGVVLSVTTDPAAGLVLARGLSTVYGSSDGGQTWQTMFTAPTSDQFLSSLTVADGNIYVGGSSDIWVDQGEGSTWTTMPTPVPEDVAFSVSALGSGLLVDGSDFGLYTTTDDGATYQRVGLADADVSALALAQAADGTPTLAAGTDHGPFTAPLPESAVTTATEDWGTPPTEDSIGNTDTALASDPANPQVLYLANINAFSRLTISKSTDGGATWTSSENARVDARAYALVVDPADPNRIYAAVIDSLSPGLLVSSDAGATWRKDNLPEVFTAIAADPTDPDRIWLGGPDGLYRSDDGGLTVVRLSSTPVTALAVNPNAPGDLVVGGDGLWTSTDGGQTLHAATTPGVRLDITSIVVSSAGQWYASAGASDDSSGLPVGGRGVLVSSDNGRNWASMPAGLANLDVSSLVVSPDGHWLYAATEGGGVFRIGIR